MAAVASARALNGWHPGEAAVQDIMNLPGRVDITAVVNHLPDQHRLFHTTRLHFLPVTTLDEYGRPWVSILSSGDGKPAFISSPTPTSLHIRAHVWNKDPILHNLTGNGGKPVTEGTKILISAIGLEVSTRRRNKFSGHVADAVLVDKELVLDLVVNQALGLCPKYISVRKLDPYCPTDPQIIHEKLTLQPNERLPQDVIDFIHTADTAYLGTSYVARLEDVETYPSHVSTNHRGGRPGFVRVRGSDGRTLVLPNYNGNRLMNSMGNIHITPLASLAFPSFENGSILYLTGDAQNLFGSQAREIMPESNVIVTIKVTGYVFIRNALPLREAPNTTTISPYSPPVRYLAEERPPNNRYKDITLSLHSAKIHNETLATFTFESPTPLEIGPIQNAVLDLAEFIRVRSHEFLDWTESSAFENDDCVRTWTVSIPTTHDEPRRFSITVRKVSGGLITPLMHQIVNELAGGLPFNREIPLSSFNITARLRGISGDLPTPEPIAQCDGGRHMLWIAGGIGITPFLSLTRYVARCAALESGLWDIVLIISTREPDVILLLIIDALNALKGIPKPANFAYAVHIFTPSPDTVSVPESWPHAINLRVHPGRLPTDGVILSSVDAKERDPHICGPLPFIKTTMEALENAGVNPESVKRERFTY